MSVKESRVRFRVTLRLAVYHQSVRLEAKLLETHDQYFCELNTWGYNQCVTSTLMRWLICRLQLMPVLASAVILGPESHGTHDHILLSQIRVSPNLEGRVPVFIAPRNRVAKLYPVTGFPFRRPPRLAGLRCRYSNPLPQGIVWRMNCDAA
jgi:hypothetical protein